MPMAIPYLCQHIIKVIILNFPGLSCVHSNNQQYYISHTFTFPVPTPCSPVHVPAHHKIKTHQAILGSLEIIPPLFLNCSTLQCLEELRSRHYISGTSSTLITSKKKKGQQTNMPTLQLKTKTTKAFRWFSKISWQMTVMMRTVTTTQETPNSHLIVVEQNI